MSNGLMNKLKHWVSGDPFEDEMFGYEDGYDAAPRNYQPVAPMRQGFGDFEDDMKKAKKPLKVVDHPSSGTQQVMVIEPRAFEEALGIIEHLRDRKSVLLNLHLLDTNQSQRVVDFLSGATHAIDGNQQRIGDGVFMFTPSNVMITAETPQGIRHDDSRMSLGDAFWNTIPGR